MMDGYTDDEGKSNASQSVEKLSPENIKAEKRKIIKNLLIMSSAFLFLFTAFQSLSNLQSSLNSDEGLGLASLCIIYASLIISCMFVPPIVINKLGCKWTVAVSMACYVTYTAANYYSSWYTLVPTSALLGRYEQSSIFEIFVYHSSFLSRLVLRRSRNVRLKEAEK